MEPKKINISNIGKHISSLFIDIEQFEMDLQLINSTINRLKNTVTELEIFSGRIQANAEKTRSKINQLMEFVMKQVEEDNIKTLKVIDKPSDSEASKQENKKQLSTQEKVKKAPQNHNGVMIFISPDNKGKKHFSGDSTCTPRRQLLPTMDEEKMILDYLIRTDHKPNQEEYNQLYKEISKMLINAPKNAIAIEIRSTQQKGEKNFIELFYHIKIKDKLDFACLQYIEIKDVDFYRENKK